MSPSFTRVVMMKKRNIDPQKKIDLVVRAARKLFVEKGFYGVTIPEIVRQSGVSVGAIYLHFGSKENLAATIYQITQEEFFELFNERLSGKDGTREKLRAFAELIFDITEKDAEMIEYMLTVRQCPHPDCASPLCSTKPFREIQRIVADGVDSGDVKAGDPFIAAISYTGALIRAVELRLQGVLQRPLSEVSDQLIENAWSSIKPS